VVGNRTYLCGDDILKSEMTVTDIINVYLTNIGLVRTKELMLHDLMNSKHRNGMESAIDKIFNKRSNQMRNLWEIRALPNGDFEVVYLS